MIKKDIVFRTDDTQSKSAEEKEKSSSLQPRVVEENPAPQTLDEDVDAIFSQADASIEAKKDKSLYKKPKQKDKKAKKKKKSFKRGLAEFFAISAVVTLLFGGIFAFAIVEARKMVQEQFPEIKASFLAGIENVQKEVLSWEDSKLSVDEYYQKQLLLLFTVDEIDGMIDDVTDLQNFSAILTQDGFKFFDIPEEKVDEYNRLMEEYEKAKAEEALKQTEAEQQETEPDSVESESVSEENKNNNMNGDKEND